MSHEQRTMKAAIVTRYGAPEVVTIGDVPRPEPKPGELLVRVRATTVSSGDARVRAVRVPRGMGLPMRLALGWSRPKQPILGTELVGVVAAIGPGVTRFREGDEVIAFLGARMGAHAELAIVREDGLVIPRPRGLSDAEAAAIGFGGLTAMHYLHHEANVRAGERVLVLGAAGAVGSAAVQIARHLGAEVTAVVSAENAALAARLGATHVIDRRAERFTDRGERWDVIMDCVGMTDYAACRGVLAPKGRLLRVSTTLPGMLAAPLQGRLRGHRVIAGVSAERRADLERLGALAEAGEVRPVIGDVFSFDQIRAAHTRVDGGRKTGSAVVTLS